MKTWMDWTIIIFMQEIINQRLESRCRSQLCRFFPSDFNLSEEEMKSVNSPAVSLVTFIIYQSELIQTLWCLLLAMRYKPTNEALLIGNVVFSIIRGLGPLQITYSLFNIVTEMCTAEVDQAERTASLPRHVSSSLNVISLELAVCRPNYSAVRCTVPILGSWNRRTVQRAKE